jgi:hypothetical protein
MLISVGAVSLDMIDQSRRRTIESLRQDPLASELRERQAPTARAERAGRELGVALRVMVNEMGAAFDAMPSSDPVHALVNDDPLRKSGSWYPDRSYDNEQDEAVCKSVGAWAWARALQRPTADHDRVRAWAEPFVRRTALTLSQIDFTDGWDWRSASVDPPIGSACPVHPSPLAPLFATIAEACVISGEWADAMRCVDAAVALRHGCASFSLLYDHDTVPIDDAIRATIQRVLSARVALTGLNAHRAATTARTNAKLAAELEGISCSIFDRAWRDRSSLRGACHAADIVIAIAAQLREPGWRHAIREDIPYGSAQEVTDPSGFDYANRALDWELSTAERDDAVSRVWAVARAARLSGLHAAEMLAASMRDDGQQVRVAVTSSNTITVWCAGPDLVDDGGDPLRDVVFTVARH